jgi:hypothetical protein
MLMSLIRKHKIGVLLLMPLWMGWMGMSTHSLFGATIDSGSRESQQATTMESQSGERVVSEATDNNLAGNRIVQGRIKSIRGDQLEIDIGNPQPLFVPLKTATERGQTFKPGDSIVVTMNDHNAVVDFHHRGERSDHFVVRGKLSTPLTVGLDKAVIETENGTKTFVVAERAKGKLTAIPVGVEVLFMADETGRLVDAQLASAEAVRESGHNNKARIKGAHEQVRAVFRGQDGKGHLKITEQGKEREVPFRPPLEKLDRLQSGQEVVLLVDDQGYVLEIASPDLIPAR